MSHRILYYDILNVAACLAVLFLHFNGLAHSYQPGMGYAQALLFECVFFWAVPVFYMLTGATLFGYRERYDTRTFFRKRVVRTLLPFLAWSAIMLVWKIATEQMPPPVGPRSLVVLILNTQIMDVYWFFIPLFMIYLAMPVLSLLKGERHRKVLWYAVGVGFLTTSVLPQLFAALGMTYNVNLIFPLFYSWLLFPVLGYLLSTTTLSLGQRRVLYAAAALATTLRFAVTLLTHGANGANVSFFWSYLGFPGVLLGSAVFVFAKQVDWERIFVKTRHVKILSRLSGCSFGVYLIHMVIFYYFVMLTPWDGGDAFFRMGCPIIAYVICLLVVLACKKVPGIRRLFP